MLQKRRTFSTTLFFFSLLFLISCTDHNIEPGPLQLTTLKSFGTSGYQIQVDELGGKPVSEYGIVYTSYPRGQGGHNLDPTVTDYKIIFTTPIKAGLNTFTGTWRNDGGTFYYYRAYAIIDGNPIYGTHLAYTVETP